MFIIGGICLIGILSNTLCDGFIISLNNRQHLARNPFYFKRVMNPYGKKYYDELLKKKNEESTNKQNKLKYPVSKLYYEQQLKRLNSKNNTIRDDSILGKKLDDDYDYDDEDEDDLMENDESLPRFRITLNKGGFLTSLGIQLNDDDPDDDDATNTNTNTNNNRRQFTNNNQNTKSKNFEVVKKYNIMFKDVGGYENVKEELRQCVDLLKNYKKYMKYNVRIPKGLILEGPPGTGKTLLSKALAGEANCSFIPVSGSDFQEKYVGIGSSRIKELFELAKKNVPCIIFIDEIDAVGRKRTNDGESSSSERDNTLNALLVELDGFKNNTGVFLVSATNRMDLLDSALTRPGRIDKKISIGFPDSVTRESIINIHIKGKPHDKSIVIKDLVEITDGLSGAQIENLLNEAMLYALREEKTEFNYKDFDLVLNRMMVGWQPTEHQFTSDIIDHIAIHEMGHAIVGILSKHHSKVTKVVINFSSPRSPGYTVFESSHSNIFTREALFEHLMILLAGRVAEEVFYGVSVTTGAINDFEEALILAEKMVIYYGMGQNVIYPNSSEKYKELIDNEVADLINNAYNYAEIIISNSKDLIHETSEILKITKILKADMITELINNKYSSLLDLKMEFE